VQATVRRFLHFLENPIEVEGSRFLAWWELFEGLDLFCCQGLGGIHGRNMIEPPIPVGVGAFVRPLNLFSVMMLTSDLGNSLEIVWLPALVEERLCRAVEPEEREPALAGHGSEPV